MSSTTVLPLSTAGITGTDGKTPIFNPSNLWKQWNITEIYTGTTGANKYIPNVNDYAVDTDTNELFKCTAIDPVTMIPTMQPVTTVSEGAFSTTDLLLGVGPGTQSDTFRAYIDQSVMPHVLAVDARLHVAGSAASYAKIFIGSQLNNTAQVISAFYDQSGHLLGQAIPLELVASTTINNIAIKTVPVCYTSQNVPDGEILTAVFYDTGDNVVSKRQLLAENTGFIRTSDSSLKYITSISLKSPFLSNSDPLLLQYPLNVPVDGLSLIGVVSYSDGSTIELPVDGTKFSIMGLQDYISTVSGQPMPLVLKYTLSPNEIVYSATVVNNSRFMTLAMKGQTLNAVGAYSLKLFGYPVWVPATNSYTLHWFMYNLDRQVVYDVTPYVNINNGGTTPFNPTAYGIVQNLIVSLNLAQVNGTFNSYNFVQAIAITLAQPGSTKVPTAWTVGFSPNQNPPFGVGNCARSTYIQQNLTSVDVTCGQTTQANWINQLYTLSEPLFDPVAESAPPGPNMFSLLYQGQEFQYTIDQWDVVQTIGVGLVDTDTLFIKFFLRTPTGDIQLAIAGIPIFQTN